MSGRRRWRDLFRRAVPGAPDPCVDAIMDEVTEAVGEAREVVERVTAKLDRRTP